MTIKIDRLILQPGIGTDNIVGYQNINGSEIEILKIQAAIINNESRVITLTYESLSDLIDFINTSLHTGI